MNNMKLIIKNLVLTVIFMVSLVFVVACENTQKEKDELHEEMNYDMTDNHEHNAHGEDMMDQNEHTMDDKDMPEDSTKTRQPMH